MRGAKDRTDVQINIFGPGVWEALGSMKMSVSSLKTIVFNFLYNSRKKKNFTMTVLIIHSRLKHQWRLNSSPNNSNIFFLDLQRFLDVQCWLIQRELGN